MADKVWTLKAKILTLKDEIWTLNVLKQLSLKINAARRQKQHEFIETPIL